MNYDPKLITATLLQRYKRFLADVRLEDGSTITVHCANTGSMQGCAVSNSPCWISDSGNSKRKYRHTWELATTESGHIAGINTGRANKLVLEAIRAKVIPDLAGYNEIKTEQRYGLENSRIDIWLRQNEQQCFVEVKSVTLAEGGTRGLFPDAVSVRAARHVRELAAVKRAGHRAVLLYCVQHTGVETVSPADAIDPNYGKLLREAYRQGVEILAYKAAISPVSIQLTKAIPVIL